MKIGFYYTELLLSSLIVSFEPESSTFVLTADGQAQTIYKYNLRSLWS